MECQKLFLTNKYQDAITFQLEGNHKQVWTSFSLQCNILEKQLVEESERKFLYHINPKGKTWKVRAQYPLNLS